MGGNKITGPPRAELEDYWGKQEAKRFFNEKNVVTAAHFDSIWWLGYEKAMAKYPKTYHTFVTKQVSGWCGCNSKLSLWEENVSNKCPQCGCENENTKHLTRCMDPGHLLQLRQLIENVIDVLDEANVTPELAQMIEVYFLGQGQHSMEDITHMHSRFLPVATAIDNLGWDCYVEGQIPYLLIETVQPMLQRDNPRGSVDLWGSKFIKSLISITHKQWLYRNSDVHQESEGLNAKQHQDLTSIIQELI